MKLSLGVIETYGLTAAIQAADAACKSASVTLLGYKKIGAGLVNVFLGGEISAVKSAVDSGVAAVGQPTFIRGRLVIARPGEQVVALLNGLAGNALTPSDNDAAIAPSAAAAAAAAPADKRDDAPPPTAEAKQPARTENRAGGKKDQK
ncbi:BMC domain-containing protein [Serratia rubidaea]|nr:BMC domain-containing protein [Serratia rubidaea]